MNVDSSVHAVFCAPVRRGPPFASRSLSSPFRLVRPLYVAGGPEPVSPARLFRPGPVGPTGRRTCPVPTVRQPSAPRISAFFPGKCPVGPGLMASATAPPCPAPGPCRRATPPLARRAASGDGRPGRIFIKTGLREEKTPLSPVKTGIGPVLAESVAACPAPKCRAAARFREKPALSSARPGLKSRVAVRFREMPALSCAGLALKSRTAVRFHETRAVSCVRLVLKSRAAVRFCETLALSSARTGLKSRSAVRFCEMLRAKLCAFGPKKPGRCAISRKAGAKLRGF